MPATVPPKPATGQPIASVWGGDVHERTYSPDGCFAAGAIITGVTAEVKLPLDSVVLGASQYLDAANNQLIVPASGSGLYLVAVSVLFQNSATWARVRPWKNGTAHVGGAWTYRGTSAGTAGAFLSHSYLSILSDGEILDFRGQCDAADPGDLTVLRAGMVRIGNTMPGTFLAEMTEADIAMAMAFAAAETFPDPDA